MAAEEIIKLHVNNKLHMIEKKILSEKSKNVAALLDGHLANLLKKMDPSQSNKMILALSKTCSI